MIDIKRNSTDTRAARLSNFTDRAFVFDTVRVSSLEGLLQSLKCPSAEAQENICLLSGRDAKSQGKLYDTWKETQTLWWNGQQYNRSGREYHELLTRIYDATYEQDPSFRFDLLGVGVEHICHSIGNTDMRDTVLTEVEMIYHLNRLRFRALGGH